RRSTRPGSLHRAARFIAATFSRWRIRLGKRVISFFAGQRRHRQAYRRGQIEPDVVCVRGEHKLRYAVRREGLDSDCAQAAADSVGAGSGWASAAAGSCGGEAGLMANYPAERAEVTVPTQPRYDLETGFDMLRMSNSPHWRDLFSLELEQPLPD